MGKVKELRADAINAVRADYDNGRISRVAVFDRLVALGLDRAEAQDHLDCLVSPGATPGPYVVSVDSPTCVTIHAKVPGFAAPVMVAALDDTHADEKRSPERLQADAALLASAAELSATLVALLRCPSIRRAVERDPQFAVVERLSAEVVLAAAGCRS